MKTKHTLKFIINLIIVMLSPLALQAQIVDTEQPTDSLVFKQKYNQIRDFALILRILHEKIIL
mgnify:CR=1 FL=1